jgi:four helix bundle protein
LKDKVASKSYRDLHVWQKAIGFVKDIYTLSKLFPNDERYELTNQIRRAAVSVPSNIAEGQARGAQHKEFARFLKVALGSLAEVDTQLEVALQLDYLTNAQVSRVDEQIEEIRKMLYGLINSLSKR